MHDRSYHLSSDFYLKLVKSIIHDVIIVVLDWSG